MQRCTHRTGRRCAVLVSSLLTEMGELSFFSTFFHTNFSFWKEPSRFKPDFKSQFLWYITFLVFDHMFLLVFLEFIHEVETSSFTFVMWHWIVSCQFYLLPCAKAHGSKVRGTCFFFINKNGRIVIFLYFFSYQFFFLKRTLPL